MDKERGGRTVTIQGMDCHLPPEPPPFDIMNSHLPIDEQKWKRTELPIFRAIDIEWFSGEEPNDLYSEVDWDSARREEIIKQTGHDPYNLDSNSNPKEVNGIEADPNYVSEVLNNFRMQEYDRVYNGMWFYNKGIATYITGAYYFYLNWWKMDVGYPKYREPDKELFYLVELSDTDDRCFGLLYITKRGTGKDLCFDSLVWTENGAIEIKDIKIGDYIYGANGKLTKVIERFDYNDQMQYEVEFEDGRKVECGEGHLWTLYDYNGVSKTMELKEFKDDFRLKYKRPNGKQDPKYYNRYCNPIEFSEKELPLEPYFIGLWLGDGTSTFPQITTLDKEIKDYIFNYAKELGLKTTEQIKNNCSSISIVSDKGKPNPIRNIFKELNLFNNKHIPDIYKNASVEQRFELLRGLLDTDGHCDRNGSIEFSTSIESLCKDISYLLNSLGIKFRVTSRIPKYTHNREVKFGKLNYRVYIKSGLPIFKLKSKLEKVIDSTHNWTIGSRTKIGIKSITPTSVKPSVCIAVDNEDKLFVTNDFIVTHNSFCAGCLAYYQTITNKKAHIGIQSKTDDDAKELFVGKVVEPYKDLPDFLIPANRHGTNPVAGLDFSPRTSIGKRANSRRSEQVNALRSKMDFKNAGEKAYDGTSLRFLIQDEVGKVEERIANVYRRWLVNRECVYRDGRKRGIAFLTTTVEEMDKGGDPCKKIWYDSDIDHRSSNGRTKTWLYRYFRSALESQYFDEYGFPLREKAKLYFEGERAALQSDPKSLISFIQKNPYTIEEAFMTQGENCIYNAAILQERQVFLGNEENRRKSVRRGDFAWVGERDGDVKFVDNDSNGMWEVSFLNIPDNSKNKKVRYAEFDGVVQWKIDCNSRRFIGYDPYSHKRTLDINKQSDAGASIYQRFDFHLPEEYTETIVADFAGRLNTADEAHEQIIMAATFFSAEILPESNKIGAIEYIERRGYSKFLMDRPSSTGSREHYKGIKGFPSNTTTIQYYTEKTKTHIQNHGHKLKHLRVVRDWLEFDPTNTTKYDSGVAASLSIVASDRPIEDDVDSLEITDFFRTFDHSGNYGKIN